MPLNKALGLLVMAAFGLSYMKLNVWQWLGIFVSIVWALAAAVYQRNADVERAQNLGALAYKTCADGKALRYDKDLGACDQERERSVAVFLEGSWSNVAFLALMPIPIAWFAAYVLIGIARAGIVGFRVVAPWATMSLSGKVFVIAAVCGTSASLLFGFVAVLNLYVETKVPVALKPRASVFEVERRSCRG